MTSENSPLDIASSKVAHLTPQSAAEFALTIQTRLTQTRTEVFFHSLFLPGLGHLILGLGGRGILFLLVAVLLFPILLIGVFWLFWGEWTRLGSAFLLWLFAGILWNAASIVCAQIDFTRARTLNEALWEALRSRQKQFSANGK